MYRGITPIEYYPQNQVSNAAIHEPSKSVEDTSFAKLDVHFKANVYPAFVLAKDAVPHMKPGSSIIITTSVTAYQGQPTLLEYSATKGVFGFLPSRCCCGVW